MKTLKTMVVREDIHLKTMECKDIVSFIVSFSYFLSHRNHRTVKWGPSEERQKTNVMLNPNPMSSSEDNERKAFPQMDQSALLVAQAKLSHLFEIRPLDTCPFPNDLGSFQTNHVGLSLLQVGPNPIVQSETLRQNFV